MKRKILHHLPYFLILLTVVVAVACIAPVQPMPTEVATAEVEPTTPVETAEPTAETPEATEPTGEPTEGDLRGTEWMLVSMGAPGGEIPVIGDTPLTLELTADGAAVGESGCNSFGGQYTVQDGTISFSELVSTLIACEDAGIIEQEATYLEALPAAGRYELTADGLTLWYDDEAGVLNFVPATPGDEPSTPEAEAGEGLANTAWSLESFGPVGSEVPLVEGSAITLVFEDGQAGGNGGCNSYGSDYTVEGDSLSFGLINTTLMACMDNAVTEQEGRYLAALQTAESFEMTGDTLTIFYDGGEGALNFTATAAPPTAGNGWTRTQIGDTWNIEHPADWMINEAGITEGAVELSGPYEDRTYRVNLTFPIGILVQTLEEWVEEQLTPLTPEQREAIEISDVTVDGTPAKKVLNFPGAESPEHRIYIWSTEELNPRQIAVSQIDAQPFDSEAAEILLDRFAAGVQPPGNGTAGKPLYIAYIQMLDEQNGWAAGGTQADQLDRLLKTADGGHTWQDRTPPGVPPMAESFQASPAAFFSSAEMGWVSYPSVPSQPASAAPALYVLMTKDGGQSWTAGEPLDFSGIPMDFFMPSDIRFLDDQFGWLIAHLGVGMSHDYIAIYTTVDGGQSWQRVTDPENNPDIQGCVKSGLVFTSPTEGWLAGDCPGLIGLMPPVFLYHTADGGQTWTQTTLPAPAGETADLSTLGNNCGIPQLGSINGSTVSLVLRCIDLGQTGVQTAQTWLYVSADTGSSWQIYPLPVSSAEFEFISHDEGWLLGGEDPSDADQQVFYTADGGQTWESLAAVGQNGHLEFNNTENGWIASGTFGETTLLHSVDGGVTWQEIETSLVSGS